MPTSSDVFVALGGAAGAAPRTLLIGEVAQAHDGSLGLAHAFIDAIAAAGADAVKFQTHVAAAESTAQEGWRTPFSRQDADRRAYWRRMEFSESQWLGLRRHADERGLFFLSSPFSDEAFELLRRVGVAAWKVASGELSNRPLLDRVASTGLPVLLSTGMSPLAEVDEAVRHVTAHGCPLTVLQCTTEYPCGPENVGLNLLPAFRSRYRCPVGLSDHSGTIFPGLAAATLGADVIEVHVTLSREMFGPDVAASVTTAELRQLADGVRFIRQAMASPVDKDTVAAALDPVRRLFTKSVVLKTALEAGAVLRLEDLTVKKPGTGIPAAQLGTVVGSVLRHRLEADTILQTSDLEPRR
ncbi:MAG: N-acetylneuraminate synthase family protein [Vicinamibacterales bacterium]